MKLLSHSLATAITISLVGAAEYQFAEPVMLTADGEPIQADAPGLASPCLADYDGDGVEELLVGQFTNGYMRVFERNGGLAFTDQDWVRVGAKVARVPGIS